MNADDSFDVNTLIQSSSPQIGASSEANSSRSSSSSDHDSNSDGNSDSDSDSDSDIDGDKKLHELFLQAKQNSMSGKKSSAFEDNSDLIKLGVVQKDLSDVANLPAIPHIVTPPLPKLKEKPVAIDLPSSSKLPEIPETLTRKQIKEQKSATAGPKWFNLPLAKPEWAKEAAVLRLRNELNPKTFYKGGANKINSPYYAIGHIIPDNPRHALETTITPKIKTSGNKITDELLLDGEAKSYAKRKFNEFQNSGRGGPFGHKKKAMSHPKAIKRSR